MRKASNLGGAKKPTQRRSAQKHPTKPAKPEKAQGGTGLAEVVAQLAQSAEKLAQAADRLTKASARLSAVAEARHESVETRGQSAADAATPRQESDAAHETHGE